MADKVFRFCLETSLEIESPLTKVYVKKKVLYWEVLLNDLSSSLLYVKQGPHYCNEPYNEINRKGFLVHITDIHLQLTQSNQINAQLIVIGFAL